MTYSESLFNRPVSCHGLRVIGFDRPADDVVPSMPSCGSGGPLEADHSLCGLTRDQQCAVLLDEQILMF